MTKSTIEAISREFEAHGCALLSSDYANNKTPLRFVCSCGREANRSLSKFRQSPNCKACGHKRAGDKNGRLAIEQARKVFSDGGAILLAVSYKNNSTPMAYICECGRWHEGSLANFKKGKRCLRCSGRTPWDYAAVSKYLKDQGCDLLERSYRSMNAPMRYRCACGTVSQTTFGNFYHRGVRCSRCGIEKLSGENAHQWKPEKTNYERVVGRKFRAYRHWRKAVFDRDDYTCRCCSKRGGKLNAHHLDDWENHPSKRLAVSNGVTLCKTCHGAFHKAFGLRTKTTKAQFEQFMEAVNA